MNVMEGCFIEIVKSILTMTFTGSIVSAFLFTIKPIIKDKLPKSFQYYMWFPVIMAFLLPLSQIVAMPVLSNRTMPIKSMQDIAQWIADMAFDKPVNFPLVQQMGEGQGILQTTARFPNVATVLFIFWQSGVILFLGFHMIGYVLYVQKLKKYSINVDKQEMELLNELSGYKSTPRLYKNSIVSIPILIGVFCPKIILPYKKYEDTKLQSILLHEMTHLRKYDIVIKWLLILVGALHWFNPVTYFVRREIDKACELACDESVIKKLNNDGRQCYGDTLIAVAADSIRKPPVLITMCEDKKSLKERLDAIMKHKGFSKGAIYLSCILLVIITCGTFCLGIAKGAAESESGGLMTYEDQTPIQRQKDEKEIAVMQAIYDYDKENIVGVWVALEDSDNGIVSANIMVVSKNGIADANEQDKLEAIASGYLNLDARDISLLFMDSETFFAQGKE